MGYKKFLSGRRIFINLVLSYLLVLFITLFVSSLFYIKSIGIIDKSVDEQLMGNLVQFKSNIDMDLQNIEKLASLVELNEDVNIALSNSDKSQAVRTWTNKKIGTYLEQLGVVNSFVKQIGVFLPYDNIIITNFGAFSPEAWFNDNIDKNKMNFEEYLQLINKLNRREYKVMPATDFRKGAEKVLFLKSLTYTNYKNPVATLFVLFDFNIYSNAYNGNHYANMFIDNGNKEVLFSNRYDMDKQIVSQKDFNNNQTQNIVAIEKTKYSVVKLKSSVNGWYYNSAIPLSEPEEKLVIIKNLAVVCFILSLAIGIGISITFSRNNSNKVNSIIKLFGGESAQDKGDEYDYIKGRIGDLIQRQSRMMEKLNKQDVIVKSVLLNRLLTGKLKDDDNISELYESLNINPEESVFTVMLIDTEKLESRLMNAKLEGKDYAFIPGIVSYIVQDSLKIKSKEQYEVLVTELDNLTACLLIKLTKSKNNDEFFTEISEVVSLFREDFIKEFEIDMAIALSRVHKGLVGVNEAYNEASDVMEYIKLVGVNTIIYAENVKFKENDIDAYSDKTRELFKNYIKVEDYEAAKKLLSDTFEKQLNNGEIPPIAVLNGQIISFMNAFLGAISELDVELSQSVFEYLKPSNRLIKCRSILEIQIEIRALLDELSDFVIKKRSELQGSHKKLITDYIEENITDANLSVTIIAEHFGMTQSNLSKYFKKEFGLGILEYIHQLRLELAKKLIVQDISLKEISQRVGLYNDIALIRIFKKYENITPKNYREKIMQK